MKDSNPNKIIYYGSIGKDEVGGVLKEETKKVRKNLFS